MSIGVSTEEPPLLAGPNKSGNSCIRVCNSTRCAAVKFESDSLASCAKLTVSGQSSGICSSYTNSAGTSAGISSASAKPAKTDCNKPVDLRVGNPISTSAGTSTILGAIVKRTLRANP